MSQQQVIKRMERFTEWMKQEQIDFALVSSPSNVYYLTGFYTNPHERFMGLFITSGGDVHLIVPELDKNQAIEKGTISKVLGYSDAEGPNSVIKQVVTLKDDARFGMEHNYLNFKVAQWLLNILEIPSSIDIEEGLMKLRLIKDKLEIEAIQEAAHYADQAIEIGIKALAVGKSEREIIAEIEYQLKKQGVEKMSFETMVLTGAKSALPHGKPDGTKIQDGDFVLFDLGVVAQGYCSDISRTVVMGKATEEQKKIYTTVLQAQQKAIETVKPNIAIKQIDLAARDSISSAGYGEYFIHRTGHGLGLDIHETPSIHQNNEEPLLEGYVFTIEPGIYVPKVGGVRIEDDILVTAKGSHIFTTFTKDLIEL